MHMYLFMNEKEFIKRLMFLIAEIKHEKQLVCEDSLIEFTTGETYESQKELMELDSY